MLLGKRKANKLIKVAKQTMEGASDIKRGQPQGGLRLIAQGFRTLGCAG